MKLTTKRKAVISKENTAKKTKIVAEKKRDGKDKPRAEEEKKEVGEVKRVGEEKEKVQVTKRKAMVAECCVRMALRGLNFPTQFFGKNLISIIAWHLKGYTRNRCKILPSYVDKSITYHTRI